MRIFNASTYTAALSLIILSVVVEFPSLHAQDYYVPRDLKFTTRNGNLRNYEMVRIKDLSGEWKFEIGDDSTWAQVDFDDRTWDRIKVPSAWEDEGFPGYDGYAWYRTRFTIDSKHADDRIYLYLGYIDDVDEVYLNGHFVGFNGHFPPDVFLTDFFLRRYLLPVEYLNFRGENVLAVRVYDHRLLGGITSGKIGLYRIRDEFKVDFDLSGYWRFKAGDEMDWQDPAYDDSDWERLLVPLNWEMQGHRDLDGFAWYRKGFRLPSNFPKDKMILMLGLIDDLDATYLNGRRIGRHGLYGRNEIRLGNQWVDIRAYYIPENYLNRDGENILAVRVYDSKVKGGIYDGPIGIVRKERYMEWKAEKEDFSFGKFFRFIFGTE
ncbi:MAG: sugar-binding domain-containing protein [candidate division KSB1 bacterium]|jgi:sialate O-acetylesterase|nr:sugar-binding domain-containing protein [candidate division KSB1 bacterium]